MKVDWDELKRLHANRDKDVWHWHDAISAQFPAILAERSAAQRFINHVEGEVACYLGSGDDGVIGDANVLRAVTIMHKRKMAADNFYRRIKEISDSGDCGKMLEDAIAAFDKDTQNEG